MSTILLKPALRFRVQDVKATTQNITVRIAEQFGKMNTARKQSTVRNDSRLAQGNDLMESNQRVGISQNKGRTESLGLTEREEIGTGSVDNQDRLAASALVNRSESSKSQVAKLEGANSPEISVNVQGNTDERNRDLVLVTRAQEGDSDAYRELVELYQGRAQAIAIGLLGNFDDAQDLVQQAFLKAYRSIGSFRGQSSFYTWLYRILVNLSIDLSRKAYRKTEQGFEDSKTVDALAQKNTALAGEYLGHLDTPDEHIRRVELRKRLHAALSSLSEEHRTVIVLREIEGLSYTEISDAVGCSKGTVMSRLHHARKKLQSALGDLMPEGALSSEGQLHSDANSEYTKTSSSFTVEE